MKMIVFYKKYFLLLFILSVIGVPYGVNGQTVATIAGGDTLKGYSGDGGPAIEAELANPQGMAVDSKGNLYIADIYNNVVRRIDPSGVITTFAGTGVGGYNGDGRQAKTAQLNEPYYVAVDTGNNIYISDSRNSRIRKVNGEGIISTFAGNGTEGYWGDRGPATAAELSRPAGMAFDPSGNMYISDLLNLRIRKVTPDGEITSVCGVGQGGSFGDGGPATAASLDKPFGITTDFKGNVYVADCFNNRIRKIDAQTGIISTYAGGAGLLGGYYGDGRAATAAMLNNPTDVKCDDTGALYIADSKNFRIRKVDTFGIITTIAGNGVEDHGGDGGPATAAQFVVPFGLALDYAGNLFVSEFTNDIRYVHLAKSNQVILSVYPNPTFNGQVNVYFGSHYEENVKVIVVDMTGRQLFSTTTVTNKTLLVNIEPAGYYFIRGTSAHGSWKGPISVAH